MMVVRIYENMAHIQLIAACLSRRINSRYRGVSGRHGSMTKDSSAGIACSSIRYGQCSLVPACICSAKYSEFLRVCRFANGAKKRKQENADIINSLQKKSGENVNDKLYNCVVLYGPIFMPPSAAI